MKYLTIACACAVALGSPSTAETIRLTTVDFKLPSDFRAQIPKGTKKSDIFVSDDNCYYYCKNLSFVFIGCIG